MGVVVAVSLVYVSVLFGAQCLRSQSPTKNRQRSFFLYCDMCLWLRGCLVLLHIELSVSARYQNPRVLLRERRLLLGGAANGNVRHMLQNYIQS